jgi:hypothetical protein
MRRARIVWTLALLGFASACANGAGAESGSSLSAAVEKTLSVEGFHIEGTSTIEGMTIRSEGDYVAPDRVAISSTDGPSQTFTIVIGRDHYVSEPEDPGTFSLWQMPCEVGVDTFIPALAVVSHAEDVERSGDSFLFRADGLEGTVIEGVARVEGVYLAELVLRYTLPRLDESVEERWAFSDFGTTVRIEPPPKEHVLADSRFDGDPPLVPSTGEPPGCP